MPYHYNPNHHRCSQKKPSFVCDGGDPSISIPQNCLFAITQKSNSSNSGRSNKLRRKGKIGHDIQSIKDVIELHSRNRIKDDTNGNNGVGMTPAEISFCWNQISKLVTRDYRQKKQLRDKHNHKFLRPLLIDTKKCATATATTTGKSGVAFNPIDLTTTCHKLAKLYKDCGLVSPEPVWMALEAAVVKMCESDLFDARQLSNVAWALASAERFSTDNSNNNNNTWNIIAQTSVKRAHEFNSQDISNILFAFAKANQPSPLLFNELSESALRSMDTFNSQALANTVWSYAKVGHASPALFDKVAECAIPRLSEFNAQELANTLWAYATAEHKSPALFDAVADVSVTSGINHKYNSQDISNIVWAYATAGYASPALFDALAKEVLDRSRRRGGLMNFESQAMANIVWAFATIAAASNHNDNHQPFSKELTTELFGVIAEAVFPLLSQFNQQDMANTVWAYAKTNNSSPLLFDSIANAIVTQSSSTDFMVGFTDQGLSNIVWAYGTARHESPALFDKIASVALSRIKGMHGKGGRNDGWFSAQVLANTAWAFATQNHYSPDLFDAIASALDKSSSEWHQHGKHGMSEEYTPQNLVNIVWAFAIMDHGGMLKNDNIMNWILSFTTDDESFLDNEEMRQLHQYMLWCREKNHHHNCTTTNNHLLIKLQEQCSECFVDKDGVPSQLQRNVASVIQEIGLTFEEEARAPETGYSVDMMITTPTTKRKDEGDDVAESDEGQQHKPNKSNLGMVAVEIDGPWHYLTNSRTPTGSTRLKHRQIRALDGIRLVSIPYWEWGDLNTAAKTNDDTKLSIQKKYLEEKIGLHLS